MKIVVLWLQLQRTFLTISPKFPMQFWNDIYNEKNHISLVPWYRRMIFAFILKPYKIPFLWSAIQTHNIKASDLIFCHFTCKPSWQGSTLLLRSLLLEVEPLVKHAWRAKSFTKTSNRTMPKVTRLTSRWAINLKYRLVVEKLHVSPRLGSWILESYRIIS